MSGAIDVKESSKDYYLKMFLFYVLGIGPNWVIASAFASQIPYLEETQPEGHAISAFMNMSNALNIIFVFSYWLYTTYVGPISHRVAVPAILILSCFVGFLAIGIYDVTVNNVSICLYLCCLIGGTVGGLSAVVMQAFMTNYEKDCISLARSGGSGTILLVALLSIAQNIGPAEGMRFSPRIFFMIFALILIAPIIAYKLIIDNDIGLKTPEMEIDRNKEYDASVELAQIVDNPLNKVSAADNAYHPKAKENVFIVSEIPVNTPLDFIGHNIGKYVISLSFVKNRLSAEQIPWAERLVPYILTICFVNFNTWGLMTALIPYAMDTASGGDGSSNLAIANQIAAFTLFMGDLSTARFTFPFAYGIIVFAVFTFTIYSASFSSSGGSFETKAAAPILIILFALSRFIEAHLLTATYRTISFVFPPNFREQASRSIGYCDQISTVIGAMLSLAAVSSK